MDENVKAFMEKVMEKNAGEKEFHQAVQEFAESALCRLSKKTRNTKKLRY